MTSAHLQARLTAALKAMLPTEAMAPEYGHKWKSWPMSTGLPIPAIRASGRRTSDSGSSGAQPYPTPRESDRGRQRSAEAIARAREKGGSSSLEDAAQLAPYITPSVFDATNGNTPEAARNDRNPNMGGKAAAKDLAVQAQLAPTVYATPAARDWISESATEAFNLARDAHSRGKPLSYQAQLASGTSTTPSPSGTGRRAALNPELSRWLMGFPPSWSVCGRRAFAKLRKR